MILDPISLYCERTTPGLWDEPFSLLASLAFLPAGIVLRRFSRDLPQLRLMAALSLFMCPAALALHSFPSLLTLALSLLSILVVMLHYVFLLTRDVLRLPGWITVCCVALILPFAVLSLPLVVPMRGAVSSVAYAAVPLLILGYAVILRHDAPDTAKGLFVVVLMMAVALVARSADVPLCGRWPHGTHFLWIILGACILVQMGRVYRRHMLAGPGGGG